MRISFKLLLLLLLSTPCYAATEFRNEGTSTGYVNVLDCVGAGIDCTKSGIVGTVTVAGGGGGEANTASNVGTGIGVFKQKSVVDLQFKSLVSGDNTTISQDSNSIVINVPTIGQTNTASNLGTGNQWFESKSGSDLRFRTAISGDNVTMVTGANDVTINVISIPSEDIVGTIALENGGTAATSASAARTSLGLGTIATQNANNVSISGGSVTGITDIVVADGGTGVSTITDGGVLIGKGTAAIENTGLLGKGALIVGDGVTNPTTLTVGTNGQILSADSSTASGLVWIAAPSGGGSGDITSIGDVTTGAAFDGTQGTTLTFYNVGGNETAIYDGTNIAFSKTISATNLSGTNTGDNTVATTWGSVTGTLGNQTDLQSALDAKQVADADLTDLADGSLTPSKVESFPIGAVFISVVSTNPNTLLGYGTWSAIASGRVLVGLNSGDTDFDVAEETGGAKTVASSAQTFAGDASTNIVNHTHTTDVRASTTDGTWASFDSSTTAGSQHLLTSSNPVSGGVASYTPSGTNTPGAATSVVQPYFVVYMWKRTA